MILSQLVFFLERSRVLNTAEEDRPFLVLYPGAFGGDWLTLPVFVVVTQFELWWL